MIPSTPRKKRPSSATSGWQDRKLWRMHYQVAATSVDVTDLLNSDFELIQIVERAITHLGVQSTVQPPEDRLTYAEQILTLILDLQSDRVVTLVGRLTGKLTASSEWAQTMSVPATISAPESPVEGTLRARCDELNRLANHTQPSDYAMLKTGGRDAFSAMPLARLMTIIPSALRAEMEIRLRAGGSLSPVMELKVARWIARGLDVSHAIEKVKWDIKSRRR